MGSHLNVLVVEAVPEEAQRAVEELDRRGFSVDFERVDTASAMRSALSRRSWDIIIADYSLPGLSALEALDLVRTRGLDTPVIVVSDAAGEEAAVAAMRAGAQDYVLKNDLLRLGPAVERELREVGDRQGRRQAEEALKVTSRELDEAQKGLLQSEKLAALGRLSSGVAHEVKNPLGIILGGIEFLEVKLARQEIEVKTALAKMKEAALRAANIIDSMLRFARPSELKLELVDPNELVREALSLFQYSITTQNVQMIAEFAPGRLRIMIDRNQMQQVLFNLLSNAVESMPQGGDIVVRVSKLARARGDSPEARVVIEIEDRGVGIAPEHMRRLFEPFFTTKQDRKGTGLGLSTAKTIVEHHQGDLIIASETGKGTRARILLPAAG